MQWTLLYIAMLSSWAWQTPKPSERQFMHCSLSVGGVSGIIAQFVVPACPVNASLLYASLLVPLLLIVSCQRGVRILRARRFANAITYFAVKMLVARQCTAMYKTCMAALGT